MTQEELKKIETDIRQMIKKIKKEINEMENMAAPVAPENSIGRISRMDAINNKSVVEASLHNRRRKLAKLQVALSNVRKPGFGVCSNCKKGINPKRLMLLPESNKCIRCA